VVLRQGTYADSTEESVVLQNMFDLQDDVPGADWDLEWRTLVSQQAHPLGGILQRLQTAIAGVERLTEVPALAADVERFLAAQAQQHVRLEHERGQLRALATILPILDKAHTV